MQREYRLRSREDFSTVYRRGKSVANHQFVLYFKEHPGQAHFRLGISVSKKVGGAVERNRLRRMIKEIVRHLEGKLEGGYDLILIVRRGALGMDYHAMEKSIRHVLRRGALLKK